MTVPASGATTAPSVGRTATPSPRTPAEKTASSTSAEGHELAVDGADELQAVTGVGGAGRASAGVSGAGGDRVVGLAAGLRAHGRVDVTGALQRGRGGVAPDDDRHDERDGDRDGAADDAR